MKQLAKLTAIEREPAAQQGRVLAGVASIGARVRDDQPDADATRLPPATCSDLRDKTPLAIESAQQFIDVDELGLELNEEQMPGFGVPGELVDHASLSVDGERDFRLDLPALGLRHRCGEALREDGVTAVEQPVEVACSPPSRQLDSNVHGRGDASDRDQRQRFAMAALEERHGSARHAGGFCQIQLAKPASSSNRPNCGAQPLIIHSSSFVTRTSLALIRAGTVRSRSLSRGWCQWGMVEMSRQYANRPVGSIRRSLALT